MTHYSQVVKVRSYRHENDDPEEGYSCVIVVELVYLIDEDHFVLAVAVVAAESDDVDEDGDDARYLH